MKVTLVTCFNASWLHGRVPTPYVPLNLLGLAAALQRHGHQVEVVDQTLALLDGRATDGPRFYDQICDLIEAGQPQVVGLTTMCNSYPQTLSLARRYRARAREAKIVLGGPQATVVDVPTLEAFPWIDAIVRGEADQSFPALVDLWQRGELPQDLAGVSWREDAARVRRNPDALLLLDLDDLPIPAYELYPLRDAGVHLLPIEAGRGCPYGCTFCSTNVFFNRRYRIKSPERILAEMRLLNQIAEWTRFDLVHDMFTVDRRYVSRFCRTLIEAGSPFEWGCSARIDRVDPELLSQMRKAGCIGMFFGVETGSQRLQPIIKKNLDMQRVLPVLEACLDNQISPTASCITGYPPETTADAMDSFHHVLDVLALSPKTRAQMHLLAPLVGSPLYDTHKGELRFDGQSSDISLFMLTDEDTEMVQRYPGIFPNFYYLPTPHVERDLLKAISAVTYSCYGLFIALRRAGADLQQVLEGWVAWKREHVEEGSQAQDYYLYRFGLDMCRYLRERVLPALLADAPYLGDLANYFEVRYSLQKHHATRPTLFVQFEHDVVDLTRLLRSTEWHTPSGPKPTDLLFVNLSPGEERGYAYLEVKVPRQPDPLFSPGDEIEVRDPFKQVQTREHLIIRNRTKLRVFAAKHHLNERSLRALGLAQQAP